jgi:transcriptional regulator with XRE-family HTH domain
VSTLVARIETIIEKLGISQRELARRAGLKEPHVGLIINRLKKNPRAGVENETLLAMARGANVSPGWLLSGEGPSGLPGDPFDPESPKPPSTVVERDPPDANNLRKLGDVPGWDDAVEEALALFGDSLSRADYDAAAELRGLDLPEKVDAAAAVHWAKTAAWQRDRNRRMRQEMDEAAAELAAWRKAQGQK